MRVRLRGCGLLRRGHLGAQPLQLLVERGLVGQQRRELLVALAQASLRAAATARPSGWARALPWAVQPASNASPGAGRAHAAIGAGEPVRDMEQLAHGDQGIVRRDRAVPVHGAVAQRVDDPRLAEHRLARGLLEAGLVDQRREVVLVRQLERGVVLVRPRHRQLQRAASVEAGGARVRVHSDFRLRRGVEHRRPLALKEGELAHRPAFSSMNAFIRVARLGAAQLKEIPVSLGGPQGRIDRNALASQRAFSLLRNDVGEVPSRFLVADPSIGLARDEGHVGDLVDLARLVALLP